MRNFARRKSTLPRRGIARWTGVEAALMCVSLLLIVFPLYGEIFRWISPTSVPAAQLETAAPTADGGGNNQVAPIVPLATRETFTPEAQTPIINTSTPLLVPTDPPGSTSVPVPTDPPGDTPVPTVAGDTPVPTVAGDTPVPTVAGDTPVPTVAGDTPVPTVAGDTPVPTVAGDTPTPLIGEAPLTIDKVASVSVASVNSEYSYSLSVFGDSANPVSAQVTDELDPQTEFVSANASNGSCSASGKTVSCTINVQNNQPVAITIRVRVAASAQSGGRIRNLASVRDNANNAASSDPVFVEISGVGPTLGPTSTPDPNAPTTPPSTAAPTTPPSTAAPTTPPGTQPTTPPGTQPTAPPGNPQPTTAPPSGGGGGGGGGGSKERATQPVPTAPAPALLPPTPAIGPGAPPVPPVTARPAPPRPAGPRATAVPPRQAGGATQAPVARTATAQTPGAQESAVPTETTTPSAPTQVALDPGLFFRMASDWGSVYPGNDVYYVIALRNNRPADGATLNNLRISSTLPANLEVVSAKADRGDLKQDQNSLSLQVTALKPGEGIEIGVQTRVKQGVAAGTRIISQASAFYDGLALPAYSNIVTVQVVDAVAAANQPVQPAGTSVVTATNAITTSGAITTTNAITTTSAVTSTATIAAPAAATAPSELTATADTPAPTSTPTATAAVAGGAGGSGSLPPTSTGVPLFGFVLLGMTLMTRTVRLHRAQNRI